jgi:hypothetical protein
MKLVACLTLALATATMPAGSLADASQADASQASAHGHSPPSCRSGHTLFRRGGIRAFSLQRIDTSTPGNPLPYQVIYACLPGERRPQALFVGDVGTYTSAGSFDLIGHRLGFLATQMGGVAEDSSFGWVDVRTRVVKVGQFNVSSPENSPSDPVVPDTEVTYAIAADGSVALIGSDGGQQQEVVLMRALPHALDHPKELSSSDTGAINPDSISITASAVTWTTTGGVEQSAPR